jgi:hypothetical protein
MELGGVSLGLRFWYPHPPGAVCMNPKGKELLKKEFVSA